MIFLLKIRVIFWLHHVNLRAKTAIQKKTKNKWRNQKTTFIPGNAAGADGFW